jgi:hypothetical protein
MPNVLNTPGVLVLDTAAVISTTLLFKVKKIVLQAGTTTSTAEIRDGADRVIASLATVANGPSDEQSFGDDGLIVTGLELQTIAGTGARVFVYCG